MNVPPDRQRPEEQNEAPRLTSVDVPVPPDLAETLGYRGDARHVGFYWEPVGDEVMYDDGRSAGTGEWYPFRLYCEHRRTGPQLHGYNFGSSDQPANHWLILDRERLRAYVAAVTEATAFVRNQHPPQPPLTADQLQVIQDLIRQQLARPTIASFNSEQLHRLLLDQQKAVARLVAYLDQARP